MLTDVVSGFESVSIVRSALEGVLPPELACEAMIVYNEMHGFAVPVAKVFPNNMSRDCTPQLLWHTKGERSPYILNARAALDEILSAREATSTRPVCCVWSVGALEDCLPDSFTLYCIDENKEQQIFYIDAEVDKCVEEGLRAWERDQIAKYKEE